MGVRGLWEVVGPVARPVTLESLRDQRLAIDASIWIYQFLKAVRDSEGNALKGAHIIGFFRRICKLLFFDIKPVFVFDGDAPVLKRTTLRRRNERRQGRREDASKTAAKLLTIQLQRAAESATSNARLKGKSREPVTTTGDDIPEDVVYYGELGQDSSATIRAGHKPFRPTDQYHLPDITSKAVVASDDPRLLTEDEMEEYAKMFQDQARSGLMDSSVMDFESAEFKELPLTTQYQLLNTARLKSRLRMGYTTEQLDEMFKDRMEFSKFQVMRVAQRNYLTQTLMDLAGMGSDLTKRVAGEKGAQYILNKNEGGWTLALEKGRDEGVINLDGDDMARQRLDSEDDEGDDVAFEDVPLDGSSIAEASAPNCQPQPLPSVLSSFEDIVQREHLYNRLNKDSDIIKELFGEEEENAVEQVTGKPKPIRKQMTKKEEQAANEFFKKHFGEGSILFSDVTSEARVPGPEPNLARSLPDDYSEKKFPQHKEEDAKKTTDLPPWFTVDEERQGMKLVEREDNFVSFEDEQNLHQDVAESNDELEVINGPGIVEGAQEVEAKGKETNVDKDGEYDSDDENLRVLGSLSVGSREVDALNGSPQTSSQSEGEATSFVNVSRSSQDQSTESEPKVEYVASEPAYTSAAHQGPGEKQVTLEREPKLEGGGTVTTDRSEFDNELAEEDARYDEEEQDELVQNIIQELEEHERFARELNSGNLKHHSEEEFQREMQQLREQHQKGVRDADNPTREMVQECQELLRMFGIPFITAPREAEAQCAVLMDLGLVDGIITDDSDCFLFGGQLVLKNVFNRAKYVEAYHLSDIANDLGLTRKQLISLAHLLGSDYTDGLPGVGPVTALELLAQFGGDEGLKDFRDWWTRIQSLDPSADVSTAFLRKFKKNAKKLFLPEQFPDPSVTQAYLQPEVDDDPTPFEWGTPDLDALRTFLMASTGWSRDKVSELLVPVIQDMNRRQTLLRKTEAAQSTLTNYLSARKKIEITGSKRVRSALSAIVQQAETRKKRKQK